jgi:preprotein translocase subunit SecD
LKSLRPVLILLLVLIGLWVAWPENPGIHLGPFDRSIEVMRGLDLQGGLRVLLEADLPAGDDPTPEQMQAARNIIEKRINPQGVLEPVVQVAGARRILVELPGAEDAERVVSRIRQTALLEFVDFSQVSPLELQALMTTAIQTDFGEAADSGQAPEATEPVSVEPLATPAARVFHTILTGADLESATAAGGQLGEYAVAIKFTDSGGDLFADYTGAHVGDILAIVLDKQIISAPSISEPITAGEAQIVGDFTIEEANDLAVQLRYGALPVPLKVVESKSVGPTLGQDSLQKSLRAGLIGLGLVVVL